MAELHAPLSIMFSGMLTVFGTMLALGIVTLLLLGALPGRKE